MRKFDVGAVFMAFFKNKQGKIRGIWKISVCLILVVLLSVGGTHLLTNLAIPAVQYALACSYEASGDTMNAILAFRTLGNYRDSESRITEMLFAKQSLDFSNLHVGSTFTMGLYEQDGIDNGPEEIEWIVLAVENGRALVISKYALDSKPFHNRFDEITWKDCTLRKWLNEDFYETAFSGTQRSRIRLTITPADKNPEYLTPAGEDTTDRIWLLSLSEVEQYLIDTPYAPCLVTPYAIQNQAYIATAQGECWWWSRTPGNDQIFVAGVNPLGVISTRGNNVNYIHAAVRPAMWIDINES